jgi:hypothetical protein
VEQRRLAGTRRAHDRNEIPFVDLEVDVAERVIRAALERIDAVDVTEGDHECDGEGKGLT